MSDIDSPIVTEPADEQSGGMNLIELMAAILLGVAGILTAYAAYNGALAGGDALKGYTQSSRTTADANGFYNDYSQTYNADQALFLQYQLLVEKNDTDTAAVIKDTMFSDALTVATDAWLEIPQEADGPATPLDMDEYKIEALDSAQSLTQQADDEFVGAQTIDDQGDNFDLAAVYLAVALFFAGIAALFKVRKIQIAMLIGSALIILPGLWFIGKGKGWV
jgi:hypothetical protein